MGKRYILTSCGYKCHSLKIYLYDNTLINGGEIGMKQYINDVFEKVKARNAHEPEFLQAVEEVFVSLEPVLAKDLSGLKLIFLREWLSLKDKSCSKYLG